MGATAAAGETPPPAAGALPLGGLLEQFRADAPPPPRGEVTLDAWVEDRGDGQELVVVLRPEGDTRLNADPGITVTPDEGTGITWRVPVPHREVDVSIDYFEPPATVRLPFTGAGAWPITVVVEYAYCVVDFQCYFGEETLSVARAGS